MKLTVTTLADDIYSLDVSEEMELENLKALLEFESEIPAKEIMILWNGQPLQDNKRKLKDYGINDGEMLLLQRIHPGLQSTGVPAQRHAAGTSQMPVASGER